MEVKLTEQLARARMESTGELNAAGAEFEVLCESTMGRLRVMLVFQVYRRLFSDIIAHDVTFGPLLDRVRQAYEQHSRCGSIEASDSYPA